MASTTTQSPLPESHLALVQEVYAQPPVVKSVPTPQPTLGSAILSVISASVVSYMGDIYDGTRKYPYPTPLTLGSSALCRVAAVGPDSTSLQPGQLVLYDCTIRSRDNPAHIFLSAIHSGGSAGSQKLMSDVFRDGTYAKYVRAPLENIFPINESRLTSPVSDGGLGHKLEDIPAFFRMLVPYGGLRDVNLSPGETVVVGPATGAFGGAAVKIALAMGAGKVIAMGRNKSQLDVLVSEGNGKVVTVPIVGDAETELSNIKKQAGEAGVDVFFDISPPSAPNSSHFRAAILALNHSGRVSLMGGQLTDVGIPLQKIMRENITLRGTWMYSPKQIKEVIKMVESGLVKLKDGESMQCRGTYGLDAWKEAFDKAAEVGGTGYVLLRPGGK